MHQQDYILDMIRQGIQFLRQAIGRSQNDDNETHKMRLYRTAKQLVGIDIDAAERLNMHSLKISLMTRDGIDVARCMILGGLMKEFSDLLEESPRKSECRTKAKLLMLEAAKASEDPLPVEILTALAEISVPEELPEHVHQWLNDMEDEGA